MATEKSFIEVMSDWLITLPHDLKIMYEAAADENLERSSRELAVSAILYVVSPHDFVASDRNDFVGYSDDCILLRLAARRIGAKTDEDTVFFKSRFPEFWATLDAELEICASELGDDLFAWLDATVARLPHLEYKGKKVPDYLDDDEASEYLYEEGLGFGTEYPVDEEQLADRLKKSSTIIDVLRRRKLEDDKKTGGR